MTKIYEDKKIGKVTYNELLIALAGGQYNVESITREDGKEELRITDWNYVPPEPAPTFDRVFGNNTPAQIKAVGDIISAQSLTEEQILEQYGWAVGDEIDITMKTGEVVKHRIIDFNHDDITGSGNKAGIAIDMVDCFATRYPMNSTNTNAGGWAECKFRNEDLPLLLANYPDEWQEIFVVVDKKAANGGGSNYSETVTTSDKLFLKSGVEIFGSLYSYGYAQDGANEGTQYSWFASHNTDADRIKKYDVNGDGIAETATGWWERSSHSGHISYFCGVGTNGNGNSTGASDSRGISLTFNVGGI